MTVFRLKRWTVFVFSLFALSYAVIGEPVMKSRSSIDWTSNSFQSVVLFDVEKARVPFPSGKGTAVDRIHRAIPKLIKDPLFTIPIDSNKRLGDLVLDGSITLDVIANIIEDGNRTPAFFVEGEQSLKVVHSIDLVDISSNMVKHNNVYEADIPVERASSRPYTGIILDARGTLDVQGEFVKDRAKPCFFPKIWDSDMNLIYERNMMNSKQAKEKGIVIYGYSDDDEKYKERVGDDPLHIIVNKIFGENRTDPVISREDALKILSVEDNRALLEEGKIVILLDKDSLVYNVKSPVKDEAYYVVYKTIKQFFPENDIPDATVSEDAVGFNIQIDLLFYADSDKLLPQEAERISKIAQLLNEALSKAEFTFSVSGHTAAVGKPEGELKLSVMRAQAVIEALVENGVPSDVFSYQGFGGTMPVATNETAEGRAQNRRVEIFGRPKGTYIQNE